MTSDVKLTIVTLTFQGIDPSALASTLAKYVVVSRMADGCRNIDLCASVTEPGTYLVIEKWESPAAQRAHFDSDEMVELAHSCGGILAGPPRIELWDGDSAHDLR